MKHMRIAMFLAVFSILVLAVSGVPKADPCLVVYSDGPVTYHYDPAVYYTVGPGDPLYNPLYDRGGRMLLMIGTNYLDLSVYQPPHLVGFEPTFDGNVGYFIADTDFTLVLDGYSSMPTTYVNIIVVFDRVVPSGCPPEIWIDGVKLTAMTFNAGDLVVSTPTPYGNSFSDVKTFHLSWRGCYGVRVWAYSDANYNGRKDGGECFTAFTHDLTIPVMDTTWGAIKALYQ